MNTKKWIFSLGFVCLMLILSIAATFLPWWRIYSSKKYEITANTVIKVEYYLSGFISASKIAPDKNESISINFSISELNATESSKNALQSLFNIVWYITITGLGLNVLILVFVWLSNMRLFSTVKYIKYITIITAILYFVAFLYFASEIQPNIYKFQNVMPTEIYALSGSNIKSFFGITASLIYGPSLGWHLAFVLFLLNLSFSFLIKKIEKLS